MKYDLLRKNQICYYMDNLKKISEPVEDGKLSLETIFS
jgi:hypothetical protein